MASKSSCKRRRLLLRMQHLKLTFERMRSTIKSMPFSKKSIVYSRSTIVNKQSFSSNKPAFTLIELLVVIAIIGILAALATVSFADSQQKSRDSRRKSDLETIKKAMELAKQDSAGAYSYPRCDTYTSGRCPINDPTSGASDGSTNPDLIGTNYTYIKAVPKDPKSDTDYTYTPTPADCGVGLCTAFTLVACLENKKDPQKDLTHNTTVCGVLTTTNTPSYTISNL